ncbi:MAG: hypothetical protein KDC39_08010 [Actinobacteria bacterium]|nr:hypothetical protein [Actinomycetota bacterium]
MQRVLATAFTGVLLGGALVACSSGSSDSSPSASASATVDQIACNYYNEMADEIDTITGQGDAGEKTTVEDARAALAFVQSSVEEIGKTGNAEDATVTELQNLAASFQTDLTPLDATADISKAEKATPSPSPAFSTLQNQIYTTYQKMGTELGC